ncbi:MAG TPA: hypothetical protein PLT82_08815, partial [Candidatus Hydrogenedens sp.]|nr:hypothetical protein [Candidatus Hydrogenedens sp.]
KENLTTEYTENHRVFSILYPFISIPSVVNSFSSIETTITPFGSREADVTSYTTVGVDLCVCPTSDVYFLG